VSCSSSLEIGSRRTIFCNATAHPDSAWVAQQARNVAWELEELKIPIKVLIRDRDTKYSSDFDAVFSAAAIRIARTQFRTPRANARCERWVSSVRRECLDWLLILNRRHLEAVLAEYVEHYNWHRPHRSLQLRAPRGPNALPKVTGGQVVRRTRVQGLINEYSRQAA
jgi:putative transposase